MKVIWAVPVILSILIIGIAGSQLADATTATLANGQFGQADGRNPPAVVRTVTFTNAQFTAAESFITDVNIRVDFQSIAAFVSS